MSESRFAAAQGDGWLGTQLEMPAPTGIDQTVKLPGTSFIASEDSPGTDRSPPRVGEHTDEILAEIGYTDVEIAGFHDKGII